MQTGYVKDRYIGEIIPKVVYMSSLLSTPENIINRLNHLIYTFLWKGKDNVTRKSTINDYEGGGIKTVDIENQFMGFLCFPLWVWGSPSDGRSSV